MPKDFGQWVGVIGGLAALLVLFIGALVYVRGSYSKAKIEALRADNDDLRKKIGDLSRDLEDERNERRREGELHRLQLTEMDDKLSHALAQNSMLADMITQRANVEAIHDQIDAHHKAAEAAWTDIQETLREMSHS